MRPSFVPPKPIRELRDLIRHRRTLGGAHTLIQRLEKVLQDAGVKLTSVASALLGKSGRAMLEALLSGTRDPEALAEQAKRRLRAKCRSCVRLSAGFRVDHHGLLVAQMLSHVDFLEAAIIDLDARLCEAIAPYTGGDRAGG